MRPFLLHPLPVLAILACSEPDHGVLSPPGGPPLAEVGAATTGRSLEGDPLLGSTAYLVPGPRPIATGGRAVDQLAWAGWRLVGADSLGSSSVLLRWDDPEQDPTELARVPGRVQGLAPAPDGERVAIEAAYPADPDIWSLDDPASLLILELREGRVRTLVGATRGGSLRRARWSPDSHRIALPELVEAERGPPRAVVRVLDAGSGRSLAATDPSQGLEPLRWDEDGLWLRRSDPLGEGGSPTFLWQPGQGAPVPAEGPRWQSPDGRYTVEQGPEGPLVRRGRGEPRGLSTTREADRLALAAWSRGGPPAWCGTHHLAIQVEQELLALDLKRLRWQPLAPVAPGLPTADSSGHRLILQAGAEPWWGWAP